MSKRIQSFLISAGTLFVGAFLVVVVTPEWGQFLVWLKASAANLGVPAAIIGVVGVFLGEIVRALINSWKINARARQYGQTAGSVRRELGTELDLF